MTKNCRSILAFLITCTVLLSGCASPESATRASSDAPLRVAIEGNFPPFSDVDANGALVGFDVEIASALCRQMDRQCGFVKQEWAGMIQNLIDGEYDIIVAQMTPTDDRRKFVDFTQEYFRFPALFAAAKGRNFVDTPDGMSGTTIGVLVGGPEAAYIAARFPGSEVRRYQQYPALFEALYRNRIDSVFVSAVALENEMGKTGRRAGFDIFGQPHDDPALFGEGSAIALRKKERDLRMALNSALQTIKDDGTYASIGAKYFSFKID